jgi:hypothetical protein
MAEKREPHPVSNLTVIMGDIVDSEKSDSRQALSRTFNFNITAANRRFRKYLASPLTITLGDEFQGLVINAAKSFEIIADIRINLLAQGVRCRFVLGTVDLDTKVNPKNAWNMMGDGLAQARAKLNDKRDSNAYRFSMPSNPPIARLLGAVGNSLTIVEEQWTATQLEYIQLIRSRKAVIKVSAPLGISKRSVYKVLEAAKWRYHAKQRSAILFALSSFDRKLDLL